MILQIPPGAATYELKNSMVWFDNEGILYSSPKPDFMDSTQEEMIQEMMRFREITGNKKICMIVDGAGTGTKPLIKEQRRMMGIEAENVTKARAVLTGSLLSRMINNWFFKFWPLGYPLRFFSNLEDARKWIRKFL